MSSEDPLQRLYDDPAIVRAMDVLKEHGITGEKYAQLIASSQPVCYDPPQCCVCGPNGDTTHGCCLHGEGDA